MTRAARPVRARWIALGLTLAALVAVSLALGGTGHSDPLTGSLAWAVCAPVAIAAAFATAVWNAFWGDARLARWVAGAAASVTVYWLGGALSGTMMAAEATGTLLFTVIVAIPGAGWTVVLAVLQSVAVVAGEQAGLLPRRRWPRAALLGVAGVVLAVGVVAPGAVPAPTVSIVPAEVAASAGFQLLYATIVYGWMLSLLVAPAALLVLALRTSGMRRRGLTRVAVGALVPALVVLACGLLAALIAEAIGWTGAEAAWLAVGFTLALPLTCVWLSATVREATAAEPTAFTSIASVVRGALWVLYVLLAIQLVAFTAPALGGGAAAGAVAMALALGVTFWPWTLLVRWCVRRTDPRTAVALAALGSGVPGDEPAAQAAERILRDALGDDRVLVLIARRRGVWVDAAGAPAEPGVPATVSLTVTDAAGIPLGVVVHHVRFADLRALAAAVRPLFERAVWEAELREQAERVAAERARADAAAAEARHRIERDLHDGVQGRLVSLGLGLSLARDDSPDPVARDMLDRAVAELRGVVVELRELSSGTLSRRLDGHGLAVAVGDLAARIPVPVEVDIPPMELPALVESTAYFVIAESLTNAVKHANAGRIGVRVVGGDVVTVLVSDDGAGGADLRAGTGLRGLGERVRSVGGHLVVSERMPRGTLIEAVMPCAP